jgi:PEP-CTERM motif
MNIIGIAWFRSQMLFPLLFATCFSLITSPSIARASATGYPFWTFTSKNGAIVPGFAPIGSFSLQTSYDGQNTAVAGGSYVISNGDSAQTMATAMATALNATAQKTYWTFAAVQDAKVANRWNVMGQPAAGLTATPKAIYVKASLGTDGNPVRGVKVSSGVDPLTGTADYQLTGPANGDGTVSLGIEGLTFTAATYDPGSGLPQTDIQIEQNLLGELQGGGFSQAFLDTSTGILSIPNITTGDPAGGDGSDIGAFLSNDGDTGALVTLSDILVPEPSTIALLTIGAISLIATAKNSV